MEVAKRNKYSASLLPKQLKRENELKYFPGNIVFSWK
jgi:hypothetical protein